MNMKSKLTLAGSLLLVVASFGQAVAGPTISDKRYWPNEVGPSADRQSGPYARVPSSSSFDRQPAASGKTFRYQGGPKGTWSR